MIDDYLLIEKLLNNNDEIFSVYNRENYCDILPTLDKIFSLDIRDIISAILVRNEVEITSVNIPMFSEFEDCTKNICVILDSLNNCGIEIRDIGKILLNHLANDVAYYKYGETHSKASSILGLTRLVKEDRKLKVYLTNVGFYYINNIKNKQILTRCLLHTLIIQKIIKNSYVKKYNVIDCMLCLSKSSINRRLSNVKQFIRELNKTEEFDFNDILNNINFEYVGD